MAGSILLVATILPQAAAAGPPYLTDDPEPTDKGHWEIYNFAIGQRGPDGLGGEAGLDLNYGGATDLQLTAVLPLAFQNSNGFSTSGLKGGVGEVELAAKYRFLHQSDGSWTPDVSLFPRVFVPTASRGFATGHANLLIPIWAERDFGRWSLFGGGGYQFNPGAGQRNFWQGGVTVSRNLTERLSLGLEAFGQTRATTADDGFWTLNTGVTFKLVEHWSLLASGGPTWEQTGGHGQLFYISLKADY